MSFYKIKSDGWQSIIPTQIPELHVAHNSLQEVKIVTCQVDSDKVFLKLDLAAYLFMQT